MDHSMRDTFHFPGLHAWNKEFLKERHINIANENDSYVRQCLRVLEPGSHVADSGIDDDDDVFIPFWNNVEDETLETLDKFCSKAKTIKSLKSTPLSILQTQESPSEPVALVFDSDREGNQLRTSPSYSADALYETLSQPRFKVDNWGKSSKRPTSKELDGLAEQRHISIRDLNPYTMCALMATAPVSQVHVLQQLFDNHMKGNSLIDVTEAETGPPYYTMEFHLPYYVLVEAPVSDPRQLRRVENISFLTPGSRVGEYLCEAQISCSLSGYNESFWTVHQIIDNYHGVEPGEEDDLQQSDPFVFHRNLFKGRDIKPRERFLAMLRHGVYVQLHAWAPVVDRVTRLVEENISMTKIKGVTRSNTIKGQADLSNRDEFRKILDHGRREREIERNWNDQATELLLKLIHALENIISTSSDFAFQYEYFYPGTERPKGRRNGSRDTNNTGVKRILNAIGKEFTKLKRLLKKLQRSLELLTSHSKSHSHDKNLEDLVEALQFKMSVEDEKRNEIQQAALEHTKNVTLASSYLVPFQVASGFISSPSVTYLLLSFGVMAIMQVLVIMFGGWKQYLPAFNRLKQKLRNSQAILIEMIDQLRNGQAILPRARVNPSPSA
ncbi:hypothetical protein F5Y16DRAFT_402361 [Xylariaceae sp. FL0255]|nr:hypothetical protein F5Y16DRAFT_402361 [Xylariaceae sp. FL0255]